MELQDKFYDRDGIVVRRSTDADVEYLKDHLRQSDIDEVWASGHLTPYEALKGSLDGALLSLTIVKDNPVGMFGITPRTLIGYKASIWFLATDELDSIGIRFAKNSRYFIGVFLGMYPYLFNWVHFKNNKSLKWLRMIGAVIDDPMPYGPDNELFCFFCFKRNDQI